MSELSFYDHLYRQLKISPPNSFKSLPKTFINNLRNPENFIPFNTVKYFNEKMFFYNHRQCFNSCVDNESDTEECYKNCQVKHLTSLQLFKTAVEEKRKWNLQNEIINLSEYQKRPRDMGRNVPSDTDYYAKTKYIEDEMKKEKKEITSGIENLFIKATNSVPASKYNIFKLYLSGLFPPNTQKAIERNNIQGRYEEYQKLNEQYGNKIEEALSSLNGEYTWGHIEGEDYEN